MLLPAHHGQEHLALRAHPARAAGRQWLHSFGEIWRITGQGPKPVGTADEGQRNPPEGRARGLGLNGRISTVKTHHNSDPNPAGPA